MLFFERTKHWQHCQHCPSVSSPAAGGGENGERDRESVVPCVYRGTICMLGGSEG